MKCLDCQKECETIDFRDIKIEECTQCKSRWFDRDELRKAKDKTDEDLRWLDFEPFEKEVQEPGSLADSAICPKCSLKMTRLAYGNSGVFVVKCVQCHGVWLHSGEFEKIITYMENLIVTESAPDYVKDSFQQLLEIIKGPEDIVSEVKDFLVVLKLLKLRVGVEHPKISAALNKVYQYLPFI